MVCDACQDKPMKPCKTCGKGCGKLPPVLQINSEECPVLFHTVEVEGTPEENAPYIGQYKNVLLVYKGDNSKYLFNSDGIPSSLGNGGGVRDFNELTNRPKYDGQEMTSNTNIPNVADAVASEASAREDVDTALSDRIEAADSAIAAEVSARVAADNTLSSSVESLSSSLSSEATTRQAADADLQTQVTAVKTTADSALQPSAIDIDVVTNIGVDPTTSTSVVQLDSGKTNLLSKTTTTTDIPLPVASATQAGVMNSATFQAVQDNSSTINALVNGAVAVTGLPAAPTQAQITTAWQTATGLTTLINRAGVYDVTNEKVWTYYTNDTTWHAASNTAQVTVNPFTNTSAGIIKGSVNDGQIYAENDGTGSVNGWDSLKAEAANATSKLATIESGAQINVQSNWTESDSTADSYIQNKPTLAAVATSGSYTDLANRPTVDQALSSSSTNAVENRVIDAEFEKVAYVDDTIGTQSNTAYVGTANIQDSAVTTAKIANLNVTTDKIGTGAVTADKLDMTVVDLTPASSAITGTIKLYSYGKFKRLVLKNIGGITSSDTRICDIPAAYAPSEDYTAFAVTALGTGWYNFRVVLVKNNDDTVRVVANGAGGNVSSHSANWSLDYTTD